MPLFPQPTVVRNADQRTRSKWFYPHGSCRTPLLRTSSCPMPRTTTTTTAALPDAYVVGQVCSSHVDVLSELSTSSLELEVDEEDPGLMVMCETCKVWQHGICVNLSEDAKDQDYYCEQCRPDLHVDLLKSLKRRARHASNNAQSAARRQSTSVPRSSRSHSPGHILAAAAIAKAPKRRNTMNSRDAAYEDSLREIIESTRPDAEKDPDVHTDKEDHALHEDPGVIIEIVSGARKKRKRNTAEKDNPGAMNFDSLDSSVLPKRNRSNSSTPDRPIASTLAQRDTPVNGTAPHGNGATSRHASTSSGGGAKQNAIPGSSKSKRGRKDATASADTTDAASSKKHPNQYTYRKPVVPTPPRRPGINGAHTTTIGHVSASASSVHDHGTRRNAHAPHLHAPAPPQPMLTSWGLPDYLAHLAPVLPSDVPHPVEVRVLEALADRAIEATPSHPLGDDKVLERGVKVKWPAKRTSVGDMNKRVRGIIDWVGREQAMALERWRRREALGKALKAQTLADETNAEKMNDEPHPDSGTTHMMEELMKELIAFQEKFGPGSKGKERERRAAG
ncbi:hypothetical protein JB92DRAFT_1085662 [Gautieria morchelliformis]|nr:hypothetical protein JB92DRAFT_1085662 [Gautieria morchelliformis]